MPRSETGPLPQAVPGSGQPDGSRPRPRPADWPNPPRAGGRPPRAASGPMPEARDAGRQGYRDAGRQGYHGRQDDYPAQPGYRPQTEQRAPWEGGLPEPDPSFKYREPGPGMPGYRGSRDARYGGDKR